jgi:hypothetical protein
VGTWFVAGLWKSQQDILLNSRGLPGSPRARCINQSVLARAFFPGVCHLLFFKFLHKARARAHALRARARARMKILSLTIHARTVCLPDRELRAWSLLTLIITRLKSICRRVCYSRGPLPSPSPLSLSPSPLPSNTPPTFRTAPYVLALEPDRGVGA